MIPVSPRPEPPTFDKLVRQPGLRFIQRRKPNAVLPPHWRKCIDDLWIAYGGVCAYMCTYIHRTTGATTVEHMAPKSANINLAYEWSNYRLVCSTLNGRKSDFEDVLDPFDVKDDWFAIDFPMCKVVPGAGLPQSLRREVENTIKRLKLNDAKCLRERGEYLDEYQKRETNFTFLRRKAPFLARELERQKLRRRAD